MIVKSTFLAALFLLGTSHADAKGTKWFNQAATISDSAYELSLAGIKKSALKSAKAHRAGKSELIVFLPGARAPKRFKSYKNGPIASLKVRQVKRGTVLIFKTRKQVKKPLSQLDIIRGANPKVVFHSAEQPALKTAAQATTQASAVAKKGPKKPEKADAISQQDAKTAPTDTKGSAEKTKAAGSAKLKALPWSKKKAKNSITAPELPVSAGKTSLAASGMLGILLLGCLATLWAFRRKKTLEKTVGGIQVVAVQPFGNKHKLALVQTCGEKLLIAASDKGVRLLSHVGSDLVPQAGDEPSLTFLSEEKKTDSTQKEPQEKVALNLSRPASSVLPKGTVGGNLGFDHSTAPGDLDGLVKLRQEQSQFANTEGLLGHFSKKYQSDGAAA